MPRYNTVFDIGFSVEHDMKDPYDLLETDAGRRLVFEACFKRLQELLFNQVEIPDAFGVYGTYVIPRSQDKPGA
jgi:hypothetical protein